MNVLAVSGSLRSASINTALLRAAAHVASGIVSASVTVQVYEGLRTLPPFEPDIEVVAMDNPALLPTAVVAFAAELRNADAVVFSTPEYAHGLPGVLKNALDWVVGSGEMVEKPVALFHASAHGVFAQASLRETLLVMSARIVPEASITCNSLKRSMTAFEVCADMEAVTQIRAALLALVAAV